MWIVEIFTAFLSVHLVKLFYIIFFFCYYLFIFLNDQLHIFKWIPTFVNSIILITQITPCEKSYF